MPWYFRKSFGRGPFRLNLSKSGLGASFGVKGLRIGVGPRGTYLSAGRGGLYYRQYLGTGGRRSQSTPMSSPIPQQHVDGPQGLEYAAVPSSDDEMAAQINERLNAFRWSKPLILCAVGSGFLIFDTSLSLVAMVACLAFTVWATLQSRRESIFRRIEFSYDLDEQSAALYQESMQAVRYAASSDAIWRVTEQTLSHNTKYTAGAGASVERVRTRIGFDDRRVVSNLTTTWITAAGGGLCLLPDRMLFFGVAGVSSLTYAAANIASRNVNFRESEMVPADATNVGFTWQFVNKNGGPDKRFTNNRQLPILRYSDLVFMHPKLAFLLEFSRTDGAAALQRAFSGLTKLSQRASHSDGEPKGLARDSAEEDPAP